MLIVGFIVILVVTIALAFIVRTPTPSRSGRY